MVGGSTLTCQPSVRPNGTPFLACVARDADGVHRIFVTNATTGVREQSIRGPENPPVNVLRFAIPINGDNYRVAVVDELGNRTKFKVEPDGSVQPI